MAVNFAFISKAISLLAIFLVVAQGRGGGFGDGGIGDGGFGGGGFGGGDGGGQGGGEGHGHRCDYPRDCIRSEHEHEGEDDHDDDHHHPVNTTAFFNRTTLECQSIELTSGPPDCVKFATLEDCQQNC